MYIHYSERSENIYYIIVFISGEMRASILLAIRENNCLHKYWDLPITGTYIIFAGDVGIKWTITVMTL